MTRISTRNRCIAGSVIAAAAVLAGPAGAFDLHPPLRDDGAGWAAGNTATIMAMAAGAATGSAYDAHPPLRDDGAAWAALNVPTALPRPTEHRGVEVAALGALSAEALERQIGLAGHILQLRAITLAPGGQIAAHSHASRPGLVKVISGEWIEGRPGLERVVAASDPVALVEGEYTIHWFFNRGTVPAVALVFDIVPAE
jgi:quercetin dioxygenase-like cupin family protein